MQLDEHLASIADLPVPDLGDIDGAALAARARAATRQARLVTGSVLAGALALGFALQPAARADRALVPFGPPVALTPMVLLG